MYFLFVLFYFWIEMSNGNDLVLAQLLKLIKGYHEPRVLLYALTPIISWRPDKIVSSFEMGDGVLFIDGFPLCVD